MLMSNQGLPKEWQRLINESGISEKERRENPQTMIEVLTFYKETTERPPEDQSLEKFHNAAADSRQYAVSPTSPNTYPGNYFGTTFSFLLFFLFLSFVAMFFYFRMSYASSLSLCLLQQSSNL